MSQPAARFIRQRTVPCPTCGQPRGRACVRLPDSPGYMDAITDRGLHVSPHAARLRAEEEYRSPR